MCITFKLFLHYINIITKFNTKSNQKKVIFSRLNSGKRYFFVLIKMFIFC